MSKKYKIVVSDTVLVNVEGTLADADGAAKPFKFGLICKRLPADDLRNALTTMYVKDIAEFLVPITTGWRDQTLVLEEDGTPAEFCGDAFAALLNIAGVAQLVVNAYSMESGAKAKN